MPSVSPDALSNPRSPAGKASGQRRARMAMYWAVQSPIPGSSCEAPGDRLGVGAGLQVDLLAGRRPERWPGCSRRAAALIPSAVSSDSVGGRQSCRRGAQTVQARERRLDRLAEATRQPAGESRRGPHRDALAQDRAHRQLEAVERPGHAQARATTGDAREPGIGREVRRDHVRPRAQVEEVLQAGQDLRQGRHQRRRQLDRQGVPSRNRLDLEPAPVASDGGRPEVSLIRDLFDSRRRPPARKRNRAFQANGGR